MPEIVRGHVSLTAFFRLHFVDTFLKKARPVNHRGHDSLLNGLHHIFHSLTHPRNSVFLDRHQECKPAARRTGDVVVPCIQPTECRNTRTFTCVASSNSSLLSTVPSGRFWNNNVNLGDLIGVRSKETRLIARVYEQSRAVLGRESFEVCLGNEMMLFRLRHVLCHSAICINHIAEWRRPRSRDRGFLPLSCDPTPREFAKYLIGSLLITPVKSPSRKKS